MALTRIDSYLIDLDAIGGIDFDVQAGVPTLTVDETTHRVGIGTASPAALFEVRSSADAPTLTWNGSGQTIIGDTANQLAIGRVNSNPFGLYLQGRASNSAARSILLNPVGGNVGIGTDNPAEKLEVYGNSRFKATDGSHGIELYPDVGGLGYQRIISYNRTSSTYENLSFGVNDFIVTNGGTAENFRIKSDGNVGIGTDNPLSKLHVYNGVLAVGTDPTVNGALGNIELTDDGEANGIAFYDSSVGDASFRIYRSGDVGYITRGIDVTIAIASNTNVGMPGALGIGTTGPQYKLEVIGDSGIFVKSTTNAQTDGAQIRFSDHSTGSYAQYGWIRYKHSNDQVMTGGEDGFIIGGTETNTSVRIDGQFAVTGNVGIGTTNPQYKLEVNGSFAAITKSFVIPHPTKPGYKLRHGSLEGPENGVYVRGRSKDFIIELPDYWVKLVDADSITVNLTPVGKSQTLWVKDIKDNRVYVGSKCSEVHYFYTVFAERADVERLQTEINCSEVV